MELTLKEIESRIYETILAEKRRRIYTRITINLLIQIGKSNTYVVRKNLQNVLITMNIDEAIEKYNLYND